MPTPKKPRQLKVVAGTDRPDRAGAAEIDLPPIDGVPSPPDWLANAHAIKEWKRLAKILCANNLLTELDLGPLGHLCSLHGKIVQLYTAGESPSASMLSQLRNFQNDFGLSPVARGKVTPAGESGNTGNPFGEHGKKQTK